MSDGNIPTAMAFRDAFISAYGRVRAALSDERFGELWSCREWNALMLTRSDEASHQLPKEIVSSVLSQVATELGLCYPSKYPNRQPMTFDGVFVDRSDPEGWFPVKVAIEHENSRGDFWSEVQKLLSVRCPLKVGITYSLYTDAGEVHERLRIIENWIRTDLGNISRIVAEDPATEYLFLVGVEFRERCREISQWYSLDFRSSDGPQDGGFQLVQVPAEGVA